MTLFFTNMMNTINNSKFLSTVVILIIIIAFINFSIYIIRLLSNIRAYIVNKSNSFYLANQKNSPNNVSLSMPDRLELTNSILDLISFMVQNEIVSHFKSYIALNTPYEISKLDNDAADISKKVFEGISKDLFNDPNLILTDKYLMEFITKKTINVMIDIAQTHNNNIRANNQSVGE